MKRSLMMLLIIVLLLCACNNANPSENMAYVENGSSHKPAESSEVEKLQSEWDNLKKDAYRWLEKDEFLLLVGPLYEGEGRGISDKSEGFFICRLIALDYSFDRTIQCTISDSLFYPYLIDSSMYLSNIAAEEYYPVEMEIDAEAKAARLTLQKTNYLFNFQNGEYTVEIKYRTQDLNPRGLQDKSPDKNFSLYKLY